MARHEIIGLGEISMGQRRIVWVMEMLRIIGKTEKEAYLLRRIAVGVLYEGVDQMLVSAKCDLAASGVQVAPTCAFRA
jgi:hypothetical protein